jgi:ribosomal protein S18 acetylase RimI-like enzyme
LTKAETIRIRRAALEDLDDLVDLHYASFEPREHMALYLGRDFIRAMYRWFIGSPRTVTIVAEDQGKIVGLHTGCSGPYFNLMFTQNKAATVRSFVRRPWVIFYPVILKRFMGAFFAKNNRLHKLAADRTYMNFGIIAIHYDYRKKGLGVALTDGLVEEGYKRGWYKFYLITYKRNDAAARTLKSSGGWMREPLGENKFLWIKHLDPPDP